MGLAERTQKISSQNNLKHGYYCRNPMFDDTAAFRAFMKRLRRDGIQRASTNMGPPVAEDEGA